MYPFGIRQENLSEDQNVPFSSVYLLCPQLCKNLEILFPPLYYQYYQYYNYYYYYYYYLQLHKSRVDATRRSFVLPCGEVIFSFLREAAAKLGSSGSSVMRTSCSQPLFWKGLLLLLWYFCFLFAWDHLSGQSSSRMKR